MELRQAHLAAMALVLVLAGCSQLPSPNGSTATEPAPLRDAPQQVGDARGQLAELAEPVRTDTALAWARSYLVNERADDAGELLDQVGDGALSRDQRFRWLQLRAQSWMAAGRTWMNGQDYAPLGLTMTATFAPVTSPMML